MTGFSNFLELKLSHTMVCFLGVYASLKIPEKYQSKSNQSQKICEMAECKIWRNIDELNETIWIAILQFLFFI